MFSHQYYQSQSTDLQFYRNHPYRIVDVYYNLEDYLVKAVGEYIIQDKDNLMKEYKEEN